MNTYHSPFSIQWQGFQFKEIIRPFFYSRILNIWKFGLLLFFGIIEIRLSLITCHLELIGGYRRRMVHLNWLLSDNPYIFESSEQCWIAFDTVSVTYMTATSNDVMRCPKLMKLFQLKHFKKLLEFALVNYFQWICICSNASLAEVVSIATKSADNN